MSFKPHLTDDGRIPAQEKLPASAIIPNVGMALYFASGLLAVASDANAATHICMESRDEAVGAGEEISVIKILPDMVFETQLDADGALVLGTGYDIAAGGLTLAGTSAGAAAFVVDYVAGEAAGDAVRGRFKQA